MKKLNVKIDGCNCYQCGPASTYTYENETEIYPSGEYAVKFYEVEWNTISEEEKDHWKHPDAITKDGYRVMESSREEITGKQWADTWRVETHAA